MTNEKKITDVVLVFENCDSASIKYDDIYNMSIHLDKKEIEIPSGWKNGGYQELLHASFFVLQIFNMDTIAYVEYEDHTVSLLTRLKYPDITHVKVNYNDGSYDYITLPYKPKDEFSSIYQTVSFIGQRSNYRLLPVDNEYVHQNVYELTVTKQGVLRRNWRLLKEYIHNPRRWWCDFKGRFRYSFIYHQYWICYVRICDYFYAKRHSK